MTPIYHQLYYLKVYRYIQKGIIARISTGFLTNIIDKRCGISFLYVPAQSLSKQLQFYMKALITLAYDEKKLNYMYLVHH